MSGADLESNNISINNNDLFASLNEKIIRLSQMIHGLAAAIYICDAQGYIRFYNKAAADLWGRDPVIGVDLWCGSWKIFEQDGITILPLDKCPMAIALREGKSVRGIEILIERPDGLRRNVMPYPDPVFNSDGAVVEAINMLVDITDLKQKEKALYESEIKYRELAENLQLTLKAEEEFIAIASHELKTPITSIKIFLELLLQMHPETKDSSTNFMLSRSKAQVDTLIGLITDLLDVTKIKSGKFDLNFEELILNDIIDIIIQEYSCANKTHKIIKRGISNNKVRCDKNRIEQVIINLLTNAVKYSPNAKEINVTITDNANYIQVDIQDFGIGISKENVSKVFERYFRANVKEPEMLSSLGLGLYISADIIRRHKGEIWVESNINEGSTFHFSLPKC